jgi:hypothetical protein
MSDYNSEKEDRCWIIMSLDGHMVTKTIFIVSTKRSAEIS